MSKHHRSSKPSAQLSFLSDPIVGSIITPFLDIESCQNLFVVIHPRHKDWRMICTDVRIPGKIVYTLPLNLTLGGVPVHPLHMMLSSDLGNGVERLPAGLTGLEFFDAAYCKKSRRQELKQLDRENQMVRSLPVLAHRLALSIR